MLSIEIDIGAVIPAEVRRVVAVGTFYQHGIRITTYVVSIVVAIDARVTRNPIIMVVIVAVGPEAFHALTVPIMVGVNASRRWIVRRGRARYRYTY
jgi:hypothetical protein